MYNQCFGNLSDTSSKYHSVLLTSVLASHVIYNTDPIKSLHNINKGISDPSVGRKNEEILTYGKYNHLIENMVFSYIHENNLKDSSVFKGGENFQVRYMVGANEAEKLLILAVRGSETTDDWIQDANIALNGTIYDLPGKVHAGFYRRANQIPVNFFINKIVNEGYRIIITGHSLGAATATVFAIRILFHEKIRGKNELSKNIICICFGTPAVGNDDFAKYIESSCKENFHFYINKNDIVVLQTPDTSKIYIQFGKFVFINDDAEYLMSDTYDRSKFKAGVMEDHRCTHYVENLVKILEKQQKGDIHPEKNDPKTIGIFKQLFIPKNSIEKQTASVSCDLKNGCDTFCNKYSVKIEDGKTFLSPKRVVIGICCQNAEFIYKATLQLEGNSDKYVDVKAERFNQIPHMIELDFQIPKNRLKEANATLLLQTHFEEAMLKIHISEENIKHKA